MIHIDRQHLHVVLAGAADKLRGGVKPERLAVQQRGGESGHVVVLQPAGNVNQEGETGRVRLGKSILAEAADLMENSLGPLRREPAGEHACGEPAMELVDHARPPPRAHGAAKLVGLAGRKAGRLDRQPHRLLLEQGHAERLFQHAADRLIGKLDRLLAVAAAEIRMDHVPLDRAGADDGHFNHQVVKALGLQPRQHAHLGPALDLEHAHRVGPADHGVDALVAFGDVGQRQFSALVLLDQGKALADRRQHAQGQAIDLEDAQFVEIVLVPLNDRPPTRHPHAGTRGAPHSRVFNRHQLTQRPAGHDHAAGMLREVTRESNQLFNQLNPLPPGRRLDINACLAAKQRHIGLSTKMLEPLGQAVNLFGGYDLARRPRRGRRNGGDR